MTLVTAQGICSKLNTVWLEFDLFGVSREDAVITCVCQMGLVMKDDGTMCIKPALFGATPRPVPTMKPGDDEMCYD